MGKLDATVFIWGNDNYNTLGLLRQLAPYVEDVVLLIHKEINKCAVRSRFCKEYKVFNTYKDAIDYLFDLGPQLKRKGFVFTTNDILAECIDENYDALSLFYVLNGTNEQGRLTQMQDKGRMSALAKELGFYVPTTAILNRKTNLNDIDYPTIVKPCQQTKTIKKRFKYHIFNKREELQQFQKSLNKFEEFVAQQIVHKEKEFLLYGCRLPDGTTVLPGAIIKNRWHYGKVVTEIPKEVDATLIHAFLEKIGYYGVFSFEYGLMEGKAYFFEVNLRNDGTSQYFYLSGANMPLLWVASHYDKQMEVPQTIKTENTFIDGFGDLPSTLRGEVNYSQWRKDFKSATIYRYYIKDDWKPFLFTALRMIPRMIIKIILGRYKQNENEL